MIAATTDETTNGANMVMEKLPSTICAAKTAPAIGALQPAARPAAAPHATNRRKRYGGHLAIWPILEATVEEIWMMRPSRPIEAPVLMLSSEDTALIIPLRRLSRPFPATTTSSKLVRPGLRRSRKPQY